MMRKEFEMLYTERQPTGAQKFCNHPTKYQECEAMQYGHLIAIQYKFDLLEDQAWNNSAREISANLGSIVNIQLPGHDHANRGCGIGCYRTVFLKKSYFGTSSSVIGSCSCPSHASCSWVPGITSVAKESIDMDFHLALEDFP